MPIIKGVAEIVINVRDLAEVRRFYEETLGLAFHSAFPETDPTIVFLTVCHLNSPLGRGGLHPQLLALVDAERHEHTRDRYIGLDPRTSTLNHLAFEIDSSDLVAEKTRLEALGIETTESEFPRMQARAIFFRDPEGNTVELISGGGAATPPDHRALDALKTLITNQFDAALCTLGTCIQRCPESAWDMRIRRYRFSQVVFHTLFFADYYLGPNEDALRRQPFHIENAEFFGDYEELEPREPVRLYDRASLVRYMVHCREKLSAVIAAEDAVTLEARCGFERKDFSRAELYIYTIRHIQHHAAQLILRLGTETDQDVPWFGSGWREV